MNIPMLDRIDRYLKEDEEALRLQKDGWTFLTDWTFFSVMNMEVILKETQRLMKDYQALGYGKLRIHFIETQFLGLWGKKEPKRNLRFDISSLPPEGDKQQWSISVFDGTETIKVLEFYREEGCYGMRDVSETPQMVNRSLSKDEFDKAFVFGQIYTMSSQGKNFFWLTDFDR